MADPTPVPPIVDGAPAQAPSPAASPTGTPVVSAKLVPYFASGLVIAGAVASASQLNLGLPQSVFGWATLAAIVFAGLLGTTPGARR